MKKVIGVALPVVFLLIVIGGWFLLQTYVPQKIEKTAQALLNGNGFADAKLPAPTVRANQITYNDILLDPDGFSQIKRLTITYDPVEFLLEGNVKSLSISGLDLTGEIMGNGAIAIAGWQTEQADLTQFLQRFSETNITDSTLSLLTDSIGGLSLSYAFQIRHIDGDLISLQGDMTSKQKNIGFLAKLEGLIKNEHDWHVTADIEQGKLDLGHVRSSRSSGGFKIIRTPENTHPLILGEFQAGGLALYNFPLHNINGSIKGSLDNLEILTDAKALSQEHTELTLTITKKIRKTGQTQYEATGKIHSPDLSTLLEYIQKHNGPLPANDRLLKMAKIEPALENPEVTFKIEGLNSLLGERAIYRIKNRGKRGFTQGRIPLQNPANKSK